ncbi:hypothetical protein [Streptomyces sp. AF1A]|uniref:hypothetical protein n=1 Tax=Streptomyces sp. AF1A TaxID=3394350 RepID=UPI0039BC3E47
MPSKATGRPKIVMAGLWTDDARDMDDAVGGEPGFRPVHELHCRCDRGDLPRRQRNFDTRG